MNLSFSYIYIRGTAPYDRLSRFGAVESGTENRACLITDSVMDGCTRPARCSSKYSLSSSVGKRHSLKLFIFLGDGICHVHMFIHLLFDSRSVPWVGKLCRPADLSSYRVVQVVFPHPVFSYPNWHLQTRLGLGWRYRSTPPDLLFSKLASHPLKCAIPPPLRTSADSHFPCSGVEYIAHCILAQLRFPLNFISHSFHSQVLPSPCSFYETFLSLLIVLLWHGTFVAPHSLCASHSLLILHISLPFYELVVRPSGMSPIQNHTLSKMSVGHDKIMDWLALTDFPQPAVCGMVIVHNYQSMLVYNLFTLSRIPAFWAPWIAECTVFVPVSRWHHPTAPLPQDHLQAQSPQWLLSKLWFSLFINVYDPYHQLSCWFEVQQNEIITPVLVPVTGKDCEGNIAHNNVIPEDKTWCSIFVSMESRQHNCRYSVKVGTCSSIYQNE